MKNFDILLVGFDHTHPNNVILTVGRKKEGENVELVNVLQGEEALDLYKKLASPISRNQEKES